MIRLTKFLLLLVFHTTFSVGYRKNGDSGISSSRVINSNTRHGIGGGRSVNNSIIRNSVRYGSTRSNGSSYYLLFSPLQLLLKIPRFLKLEFAIVSVLYPDIISWDFQN